MIIGINDSKTLTKYISCELNVILSVQNVTQIKSGKTINFDVSTKIRKNIMRAKNIYLESCSIQLQKWQICKKYY